MFLGVGVGRGGGCGALVAQQSQGAELEVAECVNVGGAEGDPGAKLWLVLEEFVLLEYGQHGAAGEVQLGQHRGGDVGTPAVSMSTRLGPTVAV